MSVYLEEPLFRYTLEQPLRFNWPTFLDKLIWKIRKYEYNFYEDIFSKKSYEWLSDNSASRLSFHNKV